MRSGSSPDVDFSPWVSLLTDPSVAVGTILESVGWGFGIGIIVLALSLVSRAE